jgi:DNA-binding GntR family transcriptional regulator
MAAAVEKAYTAIRRGIASGLYPVRSHLKAADLAVAIGVSRTPVREALRRLHAEGIVDFVAHRGAYVIDWRPSDVDEVLGLRAVLESYAAELAARSITPAQLAELRTLTDRMDRAACDRPPLYLEAIAEANARFHKLIHVAAQHKRLASILAAIVEMPLMLRTFHRYRNEDLMRSMAHHRELVAALEARDGAWAASVMRSHVIAAHHVILAAQAEAALPTFAA